MAWVTIGAALAVTHIRISQRIIGDISREGAPLQLRYPMWWYVFAAVIGAVTVGRVLASSNTRNDLFCVAITSLLLLQTPLDVTTRRLSRPVTLVALGAVVSIISVDFVLYGRASTDILIALLSLAIFGVYWLTHRMSPTSLGWGDVLIVLPLSLALSAVEKNALLTWQLLSAVFGVTHAGVNRYWRGSSTIPFGPHLLGAAWLVMVSSV
ncbi:MAG: hypothetical protein RL072_1235 [Actinomycetota bacterium]|jgi:hypothetical protein